MPAGGRVVSWVSSLLQDPDPAQGISDQTADPDFLPAPAAEAATFSGNGQVEKVAAGSINGAFSSNGGNSSSGDGATEAVATALTGTAHQTVQKAPVQPIAASIKPRLFVIQSNGDGYELLDPDTFSRYAEAAQVHPDCIHKVEQPQGAEEAGMLCHTFLYPKAFTNPGLQPLQLAETCKPVPCEVKVPACLTSLQRPTNLELPSELSDPHRVVGLAGSSTVVAVHTPALGLKLPRIAAVSPAGNRQSTTHTRSLAGTGVAVVVVRQVIEWPQLSAETRAAAEQAVEACWKAREEESAVLAFRTPPDDGRSEEELAEEEEVVQLLQGLKLGWPGSFEAAVAGMQQQASAAVAGGASSALKEAPQAVGKKKELK